MPSPVKDTNIQVLVSGTVTIQFSNIETWIDPEQVENDEYISENLEVYRMDDILNLGKIQIDIDEVVNEKTYDG